MEIIISIAVIVAVALFVHWATRDADLDPSNLSDAELAEEVQLARECGDTKSPLYEEADRRAVVRKFLERTK